MTTADRIAQEERRVARDSYRAAGGSHKRALKTFLTADEKKERRLEHADRIGEAVAVLQTAEGFGEWAQSCELNPDVSALNSALLALQVPGEIAGTAAFWKRNGYRIAKGESAAGWITGPGFWPRAVFTARQTGAADLEAIADAQAAPVPNEAGALELTRRLEAGEKQRLAVEAVAADYGLRRADG